ncbi:hypothetical protein J5Y09_11335 [Roseomonas sp. PWR1]|uniref:Uncharacterized protein n=1 Tax=Roseomonas nitratireducens TaxID=2820810 RepID=A0ABS4AT09_9PROT|nr:hypothetical protein [Neoroseomonas nitratireducens]MBP0464499.1 hypothetical protein [Neoroseomonas nitratireducens]
MLRRTTLLLPALLLAPGTARASVWLVTEREAALGTAEDAQGTRAVTRGPGIRYVAPRLNAVPAGQPFWLRIEFSGRGGAAVNPASVRVTLLRGGRIDITSRLQGYITASGIDIPEALAPAGKHALRIEVADDQGRQSAAVLDVDVR